MHFLRFGMPSAKCVLAVLWLVASAKSNDAQDRWPNKFIIAEEEGLRRNNFNLDHSIVSAVSFKNVPFYEAVDQLRELLKKEHVDEDSEIFIRTPPSSRLKSLTITLYLRNAPL